MGSLNKTLSKWGVLLWVVCTRAKGPVSCLREGTILVTGTQRSRFFQMLFHVVTTTTISNLYLANQRSLLSLSDACEMVYVCK